jgi:hypothetical protein
MWLILGVLSGCASVGPFLQGFEGASDEFLDRHGPKYIQKGEKLYKIR